MNIRKVLSIILVSVLCARIPMTSKATETNDIYINDDDTGSGQFKFKYKGNWVHEGGYPSRFYKGDEHWTTSGQFGTDYPSFTLSFIGTCASLYGHKVPSGGMAEVKLDGKNVGIIDFYSPSRTEKTLLFRTENIDNAEHKLEVQLIERQSANASGSHEASIDYAVVKTGEKIKPTGISPCTRSIVLEPCMEYSTSYSFIPEYASDLPDVIFTSSNSSVAAVSDKGVITAISSGSAEITISPAQGGYSCSIKVEVRESSLSGLILCTSDTNIHSPSYMYNSLFATIPERNTNKIVMTALKKGKATAKLELYSKERAVNGIKVTSGEFKNSHNAVLKADLSFRFIGEVLAHDTGLKVPDVLLPDAEFNIDAYSLLSVWIEANIHEDALPGIYNGSIIVSSSEGDKAMPCSIEVIGLLQPENSLALELWQYPYSTDRYYSGKSTEEYFNRSCYYIHLDDKYSEARKSQIRLLKAAGGNSVTVTVSEDPWNSQTPDPYPSMVKWTMKEDGTFDFDYTDLDKWVIENEQCGITGPILSFSISNWANSVTYYSKIDKQVHTVTLTPGSDEWKRIWGSFISSYMDHTLARGWFDRVYMSMDERGPEVVECLLDLVGSIKTKDGSSFKTSLAVFSFECEYLFDRVTDLSLSYALPFDKLIDIAVHRKSMGLYTTLYTCGAQCSALSNEPYESLYCMMYTNKCKTDGFLRWALDAFNDDPIYSTEHRLFAAGDIFLIYPNYKDAKKPSALSSMRFEKLAEGVRLMSILRTIGQNSIIDSLGSGNALRDISAVTDDIFSACRKLALEELINEYSSSEDENMAAAVKQAKLVLEGGASDEDLIVAAESIGANIKQPTANVYTSKKSIIPLILAISAVAVLASAAFIWHKHKRS